MTLLIHVVGRSDLGISDATDTHGRVPFHERARFEPDRIKELQGLNPTDSAAVLGCLLDGNFPASTRREKARGENVSCAGGTPLSKYLSVLQQDRHHDNIRIVMLCTSAGTTATVDIANALHRLLTKGDIQRELKRRYDLSVNVERPIEIDDMRAIDSVVEAVEGILDRNPGHAILSLTSGAAAIVLAAAGVLATARSHNSSLLLLPRTDSKQEGELVSISLPSGVTESPTRGWFMGLGLPLLIDEQRAVEDCEVHQAAETIRRATGGSCALPTPQDLGTLVLTDLSRGDLAAALAVRAWMVAEYRRRLKQYIQDNDCSENDIRDYILRRPGRAGRDRHIGGAYEDFRKMKDRGETLLPHDEWLWNHQWLNDAGKNATHRFAHASASDTDMLSKMLDTFKDCGIDRPSWLSWPGPDIVLLSVQSHSRGQGQHHRQSPGKQLITNSPQPQIRRAASVQTPLSAHILILSADSADIEEQAHKDAEELSNCVDLHEGWSAVSTSICSYGSPFQFTSLEDMSDKMGQLSREVSRYLERMRERPRAIVVHASGEKEAIFSALRGAQNYGAERGVPVFLISSYHEDGKEIPGVHQFGLDAEVRTTLLRAAQSCVNRLDLLTAERLLALGDRQAANLSEKAGDLADRLARLAGVRNLDSVAPGILSVLQGVASAWTRSRTPDARARLMVIAGELLADPPKNEAHGENRILRKSRNFDLGSWDEAQASDLLALIVRTRNNTSITHGRGDRDPFVAACSSAFRSPSPREESLKGMYYVNGVSYPDLLEKAVEAVKNEHTQEADNWDDDYASLCEAMDELLERDLR
ncbi:hypothetical protein [Actinomyces capricornis]|uniref:CRISPR-associated protein n=1 Tax=Actinomyces capricornis TaxID=2755559 RepID=A0ABN6K7C0_9ACTO|nr:hypothetical protein [Actinomyces capricornis]BDA65554.1 hypothetical protein MANAM107_23880 [Actinomyces capricornis]